MVSGCSLGLGLGREIKDLEEAPLKCDSKLNIGLEDDRAEIFGVVVVVLVLVTNQESRIWVWFEQDTEGEFQG